MERKNYLKTCKKGREEEERKTNLILNRKEIKVVVDIIHLFI